MAGSNRTKSNTVDASTPQDGRWWLRYEVWILIAIVAVIYLARLDMITIRGEESRRAQIGIEMLESGDWIVPRQQGVPFLSRPPLQNWAIVGLGQALGNIDVWAIRLPSVLSLLGVVLLIYGYSQTFLSRFASFTAATAFASMVQVMELGRLGETEMMFTLFVAGSLLIWHWGFSRGWPAAAVWTAAYVFVALGTLAKGPQAPVYFAASVGLYLLITGRWRFALSWPHLFGIAVFLAVWAAWQVPFYMELGYAGTRAIYGQDVGFRFADTRWITIVRHLVEFPLEIFFGCMLPWSLLLLPYINSGFRRAIGSAKDNVVFLACVIGLTFPTVWLVPGGHTRYFLPIYPCFAPLIGLVVDRCLAAQDAYRRPTSARWWEGPWQLWWRQWLAIMSLVMPAAGLVVLIVSLASDDARFEQPVSFATFYLVATIIFGLAAFISRKSPNSAARMAGPVSVALFMGLTFVGVFTNSLAARSENAPAAVAALRQKLPTGAKLASLGYVHHLFAYYYGDAIELVDIPAEGEIAAPESAYFCFHNRLVDPSRLQFAFETIAVIPCSRFREKQTDDLVTVARRIEGR